MLDYSYRDERGKVTPLMDLPLETVRMLHARSAGLSQQMRSRLEIELIRRRLKL